MLPNLIVIGGVKCGTTSLHTHLDLHPQISMSAIKELDFFILEKNWSKGIGWYESQFAFAEETRILGESSPSYTACHVFSGVPERVHAVLPGAKLIYILRDPVDRIVSHYVHNYRRRAENRKLSEVLADLENNYYVLYSRYYTQLEQYLKYFPQSDILIITLENLNRYPQKTMQEVFRFLDVDALFHSQSFSKILYASSGKRRTNAIGLLWSRMPWKNEIRSSLPPRLLEMCDSLYCLLGRSKVKKPVLNARLKQALIDSLKDDIDRLRDYTGSDFEAWCL
jgi:hypothetical protein